MKRRGDAPVKTQISPRRIGYRVEDIKAWLDKRRCEPQAQRCEKCRDTLDMFEPIGDATADIVRKLEGSADIRDHSIKMQRELNRRNKGV
jgi:hypothetical protein